MVARRSEGLCMSDGSHAPQILIGACSSSSTGCWRKISRAVVHSDLMSVSSRATCFPGRPPRTSSSFSITASTSNAAAPLDEDAAIAGTRRSTRSKPRGMYPKLSIKSHDLMPIMLFPTRS